MQDSRSVSRLTAFNYHREIHGSESASYAHNIASADLERYYAYTGIEVQGPMELRQIWGYNDITPRTYFAQGGTAYHKSKYIRDPVNRLTNVFPEVNFISRFSLNDLQLAKEDVAFIYDYFAFTSSMTEQKYFLSSLADYCDSVMVDIVDSHIGIRTVSLGSLLKDYNDYCNIRADFTVQRYSEEDIIPIPHMVAGFLGIYGNIASCTTLHGLHACQINGDKSKCRCVGDDVFGVLLGPDKSDEELAIKAVESLGVINRDKFMFWRHEEIWSTTDDDHAWTYLKRPLYRTNQRMFLDQALFLPILGLIAPMTDILDREVEPLHTRARLLATQTYSAIKQVKAIYPPLEECQKELILVYLRHLYQAIGFRPEGYLPFEIITLKKEEIRGLFVPRMIGTESLMVDPWLLQQYKYDVHGMIQRVPDVTNEPEDNTGECLHKRGFPVVTTMSRTLSYLQKMGWADCSKRSVMMWMTFQEYASFYERLFCTDTYRRYDAQVYDLPHKVISSLSQLYEHDPLPVDEQYD
jgi:hypothetical protein